MEKTRNIIDDNLQNIRHCLHISRCYYVIKQSTKRKKISTNHKTSKLKSRKVITSKSSDNFKINKEKNLQSSIPKDIQIMEIEFIGNGKWMMTFTFLLFWKTNAKVVLWTNHIVNNKMWCRVRQSEHQIQQTWCQMTFDETLDLSLEGNRKWKFRKSSGSAKEDLSFRKFIKLK